MLSVMQRLEEQRIESTRRSLLRYVSLLKSSSKVMYKTSIAVEERLSRYHVEDDINAFVEAMYVIILLTIIYLMPFVFVVVPVPRSRVSASLRSSTDFP